jgi:serine/threonine-protein kinase
MLKLAASNDDSTSAEDETRGLLQRRLALVFLVLAGIFGYAVVSNLVLLSLHALPDTVGTGYEIPIGGGALAISLVLLSLRCRAGRRSLRELRLLEAISVLGACYAITALLTRLPARNEGSIALMLATTYVLLARSIIIPSSGRRTLLLCLAALLPVTAVAIGLRLEALGRPATLRDTVFEAFVLGRGTVVTTALATLASNVIYGLRKEIREKARIGQYVLKEKIGQGGMGVIYRATHAMLRRDTAIKLLNPERIGAENLKRFEREVKLTAQLTHPNTVSIFDYGRTPDGVFYYAMEHLSGGDLDQLVEYAGPLPAGRVVHILEQVCRALNEAHGLGLIHRDVKPNNILLSERGGESDIAKVVDFGLVKDVSSKSDAALTMTGALAGTPLYMAPESIATPESVDARVDLYSLGAVAYFLLVGEPVFSGATVVEVCAKHLQSTPGAPSARVAGVSPELDAVILRCLEKEPARRFANAEALREALLRCPAADTWSASDARGWWREHGARFHEHCVARRRARLDSSQNPDANATMAVDFGERSPHA